MFVHLSKGSIESGGGMGFKRRSSSSSSEDTAVSVLEAKKAAATCDGENALKCDLPSSLNLHVRLTSPSFIDIW